MPLDFPPTPNNGDIFTSGIKKWQWSTAEGSWLAKNALGTNYLTSANFTGTNQSLLASGGFQKLPGGLIIEWGYVNTGGTGSATISFPFTFPNDVLNLNCVQRGAFNVVTADITGIGAHDNTGFTIWFSTNADGAGAANAFWIAIGY